MSIVSPHNITAFTQYSAGDLSLAKHAIINCQKKISGSAAEQLEFEERTNQPFEEIVPKPLSASFLNNVITNLPPQISEFQKEEDRAIKTVDDAIDTIKWREIMPGFAVHNLIGSRWSFDTERLYLFRGKAGQKIPEHSHPGEEWTLLLKGAYVSNGKTFKRGDLHIMTEGESHSLTVLDEEDCICLAMTEKPIKMQGFVPQIAKMVVGL